MISVIVSAILMGTTAGLAIDPVGIQVEGEGYLRFARDGDIVYAKQAELTVKSGKVCSVDGPWVLPVLVSEGVPISLQVTGDGKVMADYGQGERFLGRLVLASLSDDVRPVESRGFLVAYDKPKLGEAGDSGFGVIKPWVPMKSGVTTVREPLSGLGTSAGSNENRVKVYAPGEIKEPTHSPETPGFKPNAEFLKAGGIQIVLPSSSVSSGDRVRLGEIGTVYAKGDLSPVVSAVDLGIAPTFGVPRTITADRIKSALKQSGFDERNVQILGRQVVVSQQSQTVTQGQFEEAAKAAVTERFGEFEVEASGATPDLAVPLGEIRLSADNLLKSGNSVSVTITAYVDGKRINSRNVKLYSKAVPVNIKQGDSVTVLIRSNDVGVEATGKVRKVDGVSGEVTVQLETGAVLVGKINKKGQVEVAA